MCVDADAVGLKGVEICSKLSFCCMFIIAASYLFTQFRVLF